MNELTTITHYCKEQITAACLGLNTPYQTVKILYQNKEMAEMEYSKSGEKELTLEIRFDNATLTYLFDNQKICDGAYLFLDDSSEVTHYLQYCSKTFQYNHLLKGWVNDGCIIKIYIESNECNLMVLPIKSIGS